MEKATFGAGCFWGVEAAFSKVNGVINTACGYTGGRFDNPTYENVCSGTTGHIEVVEIEFDPKIISYEHLLFLFWKIHDPTTINRQGPDIGEQYKSVVFFHNQDQKESAITLKERVQQSMTKKIVTEILPAQKFYLAEEYHQKYFEKNNLPSCHI
jgi:peptide-methionine (S)-S-oxide reductase